MIKISNLNFKFLTKRGIDSLQVLPNGAVKITSHTEPTLRFLNLETALPHLRDKDGDLIVRKDAKKVRFEMEIWEDEQYPPYKWRGSIYHNLYRNPIYKLSDETTLDWDEEKRFFKTLEDALLEFESVTKSLIP